MYKFLSKNSTGAAFGLGVIISLIAIVSIIGGLNGYNMLAEDDRGSTSIFNAGLMGAIALMILAGVLMVGFGLYQIAIHPKGGIRFLLGLVGIVLIGFLFYQFSEVETSGKIHTWMEEGRLTGGVSKVLNGALWLAIALAGFAVVGLIISEIRNLFK